MFGTSFTYNVCEEAMLSKTETWSSIFSEKAKQNAGILGMNSMANDYLSSNQ